MSWQFNPYVFMMLLAGAISLGVSYMALRRTSRSIPLAAISIAGAIWAWSTSLELLSATFEDAAVFHKLSFLGMDLVGVAWFAFAAQYSGHEKWLTAKKIALVSVVPTITQILVWTSHYHSLIWKALRLDTSGSFAVLRESPGVWWWVDSYYSYFLLGIGIALLAAMFIREPGLYRRQVSALFAGVLVPLGADAVYTFAMPKSEPVNLAPALFAWVGLVLYWGFTRYQLLDVAPVAREFIIAHLGDSLVVTDTLDRLVYVNPAAERLLGSELRSIVGKPIAEVMAASPGLLAAYVNRDKAEAETSEEWRHGERVYDGRISPLRGNRGRLRGNVLVLRDITERKEAELALEEARTELERRVRERTAELAAEKEHLSQLNAVAVEIARCATSREVLNTGIRLAREALNCEVAALWVRSREGKPRLLKSEGLPRTGREQMRRLLAASTAVEEAMSEGLPTCLALPGDHEGAGSGSQALPKELALIPLISRQLHLGVLCLGSNDGRIFATEENLSLARGIASQLAVALENARRYDNAHYLAERDPTTGLLNHRGISRRLEQEFAQAGRSGSVFAVVMIDVDNFKLFNDAYGHVVGDRVLQQVAQILTASLRRSDVIARYGGDEFIAILPDSDAESAVGLVHRLRTSVREHSFDLEGTEDVPIKMSYGVAVYPADGCSVSELLAAADANLYRSKRKGGDYITASASEGTSRPVPIGSFTVLDGLVTTVDSKDHYTRRHSDDVTEYALALASRLGLSLETQRSLRIAALLHDVGKVGVPDHILRKPARLSEEEFDAVKQHVALGELIIKGIPNLKEVLAAVSAHHERFDGGGYPRGLRGKDIPLFGRILAVTDAYSAMTSDRPYRKALSFDGAVAELKRVSGTQLDPQIVDAFLELLEEESASEPTPLIAVARKR